MIHEEICTYEVAKLAKEKGFDWMPSMYFHSGVERDLRVVGVNGANPNKIPHSPHISCPTQTQLQRWLREERKWNIVVRMYEDKGYYWFVQNSKGQLQTSYFTYADEMFSTYELALEDALAYSLKNLV